MLTGRPELICAVTRNGRGSELLLVTRINHVPDLANMADEYIETCTECCVTLSVFLRWCVLCVPVWSVLHVIAVHM